MPRARSISWGISVGMIFCLVLAGGCSDRGDADQTQPVETPRMATGDNRLDPPHDGTATDVEKIDSVDDGSDRIERPAGQQSTRQASIERAQELARQGQYDAAADALRERLLIDPADAQVIFQLAQIEASRQNLADAVELLDSIPTDHPEAGIPALGQSADWYWQLKNYDEAERRYKAILERIPTAYPARRKLAFLYNCQGRRHEAAEQIHELCKIGNVRQDELHSLIVLNHAMWDDPSQSASQSAKATLYLPIGQSAIARKLFTDGLFSEAAQAIESEVETDTARPAIVALYGRIVAEAQDDERFLWWLRRTNQQTQHFADYWAALGTYLISQRRFEEATRALLEAVNRDPTDMNSVGRLGQTLLTLGDEQASERFLKRWDDLNESVKANNRVSEHNPPHPDAIKELAERLQVLHRPLEAVLWKSLEAHYRGTLPAKMPELNRQRQQLVLSGNAWANADQRLCGVELAQYPLPKLDVAAVAVTPNPKSQSRSPQTVIPASFTNVAAEVGLQHAYQVASTPQTEGFAIYQTYGGAVVAFDYDLDGQVDLYFSQGGSDPPGFVGTQPNELYRNVSHFNQGDVTSSGRLHNVTGPSGSGDTRYSMGATAGDWNQDGFPDLVIANIGEDRLFINNGDGTFTAQTINAPDDQFRVPSSVAMADLTGDHLPDLFELSYVDDPTMIYRPKRNEKREVLNAMSPLQFSPGSDRICINDGAGGMTVETFTTDPKDHRTGLGLIITDLNNRPGNEIFVGNDLFPDHLWVRDAQQGWADVAPALGCAFGIRGSKTASMGIAAADFDQTGTIDIHITNYQDRNSSLFLNQGEAFLERNVQYGLDIASRAVLGFGTQAIDYDNDTDRDLIVTNGHIEKSLSIPDPYEQPPQLFANLGDHFELVQVDDPSGYWNRLHLGRGLARLDFNRDGLSDACITHLGEPSALLINRTQSDHHWIQMQLVGTESERDAIGAKVEIRSGDQKLTDWVIAGDGYFCRNEAVIAFGLGTVTAIDQVTITWPSGQQQMLGTLSADRRWLVIEGASAAFELP